MIAPDGRPIAFPVAATRAALEAGETLQHLGMSIELTDGIRVFDSKGEELPTHQAFWFAWSQFHPNTLIWVEE